MTRLIDADAIKIPSTSVDAFENCRNCNLLDEFQVREIIDSAPTIDAIPISFIEEQIELCNLIGFKRGEECYMALIEDWREENGTETD